VNIPKLLDEDSINTTLVYVVPTDATNYKMRMYLGAEPEDAFGNVMKSTPSYNTDIVTFNHCDKDIIINSIVPT